jgi:Flp pilus assembly protein TadG
MIGSIKKLLQKQSGAIIVLLALSLPLLLAFTGVAIDAGRIYVTKGTLSAAADAAVLAGATELPKDETAATTKAAQYALANGCTKEDTITPEVGDGGYKLTVTLERPLAMSFVSLFNVGSQTISAKAVAQVSVAGSVPWAVPIVIAPAKNINYDVTYDLRLPTQYVQSSGGWGGGGWRQTSVPYGQYELDYMNIAIENSGFNDYLKYLGTGYQKNLEVGSTVSYYGPSSGGATSITAFEQRITDDPNTDPDKAKIGDPRVMLLPVVSTILDRNTSEGTTMQVLGFTAIFLQKIDRGNYYNSWSGTYPNLHTYFRFLKNLNVGTGSAGSSSADYGVRTIKLIE